MMPLNPVVIEPRSEPDDCRQLRQCQLHEGYLEGQAAIIATGGSEAVSCLGKSSKVGEHLVKITAEHDPFLHFFAHAVEGDLHVRTNRKDKLPIRGRSGVERCHSSSN